VFTRTKSHLSPFPNRNLTVYADFGDAGVVQSVSVVDLYSQRLNLAAGAQLVPSPTLVVFCHFDNRFPAPRGVIKLKRRQSSFAIRF